MLEERPLTAACIDCHLHALYHSNVINRGTTTTVFVGLTMWSAENVYRVNICTRCWNCVERMNEGWNAAYARITYAYDEQLPLPVIFNHHYLVNNVYLATQTMMTIFFPPLVRCAHREWKHVFNTLRLRYIYLRNTGNTWRNAILLRARRYLK